MWASAQQDLGLSEERFWFSTPRELAALYHAKAVVEARWRLYMAEAMGTKHQNGRALTLADFLPEPAAPQAQGPKPWEQQLALLKDLMKPKELDGYEQTDRGAWVKPE